MTKSNSYHFWLSQERCFELLSWLARKLSLANAVGARSLQLTDVEGNQLETKLLSELYPCAMLRDPAVGRIGILLPRRTGQKRLALRNLLLLALFFSLQQSKV